MWQHTYEILLIRKDDSQTIMGRVVLQGPAQSDLAAVAVQQAMQEFIPASLPGFYAWKDCNFPLSDVKVIRAHCLEIKEVPE